MAIMIIAFPSCDLRLLIFRIILLMGGFNKLQLMGARHWYMCRLILYHSCLNLTRPAFCFVSNPNRSAAILHHSL